LYKDISDKNTGTGASTNNNDSEFNEGILYKEISDKNTGTGASTNNNDSEFNEGILYKEISGPIEEGPKKKQTRRRK
jgi:hypothetical protein